MLMLTIVSCPSPQQLHDALHANDYNVQHVHLEQEEGARHMRRRGRHAELRRRCHQGNHLQNETSL